MNNLHTYIQPQLESIIEDLMFQGYTASELQEPLNNINWWWNESPYEYAIIDCDGVEGTFKGWLRTVEIMTGSNTVFNLDLILQLSTTIEARWAIKQRHEQEDYMANYKPVLEVAV